jgi:hypothetical protein
VMLGGPDGGETIGYWSRFCMSDDVGHCAMFCPAMVCGGCTTTSRSANPEDTV